MRWRGSRALVLTLLARGAGLMLFPLWWMLVVSLETPTNAGAATVEVGASSLFPADPQWANGVDAMRAVGTVEWEGFLDALANSILVTFLTVTATVLSCSLVGYALARTRFRGRAALFGADLESSRRKQSIPSGPPASARSRPLSFAVLNSWSVTWST